MRRKKYQILIVLILLLLLLLAALWWGVSALTRPNVARAGSEAASPGAAPPAGSSAPSGSAAQAAGEGQLSGIYNIVLLGTDERSDDFSDAARSDAILLISIDFDTGSARLVSFERGMGVPILDGIYEGQYDWLTHCFRYGGASLVVREIEECFDVEVDGYARANFDALIKIVDSLGGVDITLTQAEADYINQHLEDSSQYQIAAGPCHLDGTTALIYSRCRAIDDDWHRIKRQRNVLQACADKYSALPAGERAGLALQIVALVRTDLPGVFLQQMIEQMGIFIDVQAEQMTIPAEGTYGSMTGMGGRRMFAPDFEQNAAILHEFLYGAG